MAHRLLYHSTLGLRVTKKKNLATGIWQPCMGQAEERRGEERGEEGARGERRGESERERESESERERVKRDSKERERERE